MIKRKDRPTIIFGGMILATILCGGIIIGDASDRMQANQDEIKSPVTEVKKITQTKVTVNTTDVEGNSVKETIESPPEPLVEEKVFPVQDLISTEEALKLSKPTIANIWLTLNATKERFKTYGTHYSDDSYYHAINIGSSGAGSDSIWASFVTYNDEAKDKKDCIIKIEFTQGYSSDVVLIIKLNSDYKVVVPSDSLLTLEDFEDDPRELVTIVEKVLRELSKDIEKRTLSDRTERENVINKFKLK